MTVVRVSIYVRFGVVSKERKSSLDFALLLAFHFSLLGDETI